MSHLESNKRHKIRFCYIIKRLSNVFLFIFGALIVIAIIMFIDAKANGFGFAYPSGWEEAFIRGYYNILFSMIISGILGIIIFTPITLIISKRLKILQSAYVKYEYEQNKDFFKFQRFSKKKFRPPAFL